MPTSSAYNMPKSKAAASRSSSREPTRTPAQANDARWWDDMKPGNGVSDRMVMAAAIHRAGDEIWRPDTDGTSRSRAPKQGGTQSRNGSRAQPPAKPSAMPQARTRGR
jgi:hypothetical protein